MNIVDRIGMEQMRKDIPVFKAGDTLKVHVRITEGDKQRIQLFQGVCIARHNKGAGSSFMVRKVSNGVGVERVFPLHAPTVERIEVLTVGRVRRAKLYYLRKLQGKAARIRELRRR
jgi:large subunit ribosomal protein L19